MPMTTATVPREARSQLVADLRRYLVGPIGPDEVIRESPADRYHTGYLSPSNTAIDDEEDDLEDVGDEQDGGGGESILSLANVSQQSAMGLTFQVLPDAVPLHVFVSWGEYDPHVDEGWHGPGWKRREVSRHFDLPVATDSPAPRGQLGAERDGIQVYAAVRTVAGCKTVTLSVVNERSDTRGEGEEPRIFQVKVRVDSSDGRAVFLPRPPAPHLLDSTELWNFELLYRDQPQFAVGHGCAVDWQSSDDLHHATAVWTEWMPAEEVPKASFGVLADSRCLRLDRLSDEANRVEVCDDLGAIPKAYSEWIAQRRAEAATVVARFPGVHATRIQTAIDANLTSCERACERIREGIQLLAGDDTVWVAFCLANRAMAESMRQAERLKKSDAEFTPTWRAFQLAFILLSLPSTANHGHPDRQTLDLIWFPTGGGKTEAYLGLTAFCLFHRRLAGKTPMEQAGTVVISRYTLRLLTVQQFERAARVILACEIIRRSQVKQLGDLEFWIGLFVGSGATPNSLDEARVLIGGGEDGGNATTLPLPTCPWCGNPLQRTRQSILGNRMITPCGSPACPFDKAIHISVVDQEIYAHPPAMVISTIDKFARMAWEPRIKSIFGRGTTPGKPPSLIIQDELHLISDSLGTISALYEIAIDHLCGGTETPVKVIGSTATIRRAEEQCWALFTRNASQFPPSGISAGDSFFYTEEDLSRQPGRLYLGVHAQGRSPKHTLAWVVGTLAQGAIRQRIPDDRVRDPFHTQVLYFNSMRELGGALVLSEDDVPSYMTRLSQIQSDEVGSGPPGPGEATGPIPRRALGRPAELSSQLRAEEIRNRLAEMGRSIIPVAGAVPTHQALDLLLSTNMISVGVDVDRLGVMVVNGQPKTTAEYIQASSRVGRPRGSAGLVVTLYNWTRPRDRSHYERFKAYHRTFYRFVESNSVTPFSGRARDRALSAVLVSMSRMLISGFATQDSAVLIQNHEAAVRQLADVIVNRAGQVDEDEQADTAAHLDELIDEWMTTARAHQLVWVPSTGHPVGLLRSPEQERGRGIWPTPQSMREVDPPSPVVLRTARPAAPGGNTNG